MKCLILYEITHVYVLFVINAILYSRLVIVSFEITEKKYLNEVDFFIPPPPLHINTIK